MKPENKNTILLNDDDEYLEKLFKLTRNDTYVENLRKTIKEGEEQFAKLVERCPQILEISDETWKRLQKMDRDRLNRKRRAEAGILKRILLMLNPAVLLKIPKFRRTQCFFRK